MSNSARLSLWQAAWVIARRDFTAIVFSKVFLLFLVGPLFFLAISAGWSARPRRRVSTNLRSASLFRQHRTRRWPRQPRSCDP